MITQEEIAKNLIEVCKDKLNLRVIVTLKTTHKMWDTSVANDYLMVDMSDGDSVEYSKFVISEDFGEDAFGSSGAFSFNESLMYIYALVKMDKVLNIYVETF